MTDTKFNAGVAVMRNSKLVSGLIGGVCLGCLALPTAAMAQFGGYPTTTPQEASAKKDGESSKAEKDKERPSYLVVDKRLKAGKSGKISNGYPTIQAAVDKIAPGGVILIMPGEYHENVVLDKAVTLQGDRGPGSRVRIAPLDGTAPCLAYNPENESDHALVSNIEFSTTEMVIANTTTSTEEQRSVEAIKDKFLNQTAFGDDVYTNNACISVTGGVFTMKESTVNGLLDSHSPDLRSTDVGEFANNEIATEYEKSVVYAQPDKQVFYDGVMIDIKGGTAFLEKNTIRGGMEGVRVSQQDPLWDRTVLVDNKVTENYTLGLHLRSDSGIQATGNLIEKNKIGIKYNGEGDATIVGNKILNNFDDGVLLDRRAKQVMLSLNKIARNQGNGINIFRATGYIHADNIFESNGLRGEGYYDVNTTVAERENNNMPKIENGVPVNQKSEFLNAVRRDRENNRRNRRN